MTDIFLPDYRIQLHFSSLKNLLDFKKIINSKINFLGSNCPGYNPGPGYPIQPTPIPIPIPGPGPTPPKPIGGCSGTRYGCCPNGNTPKFNDQGSNCI
jgi:hypothetical protein